jgi:glucosamine--fructose-6-phosphate aminotransferase (isomerizing)
MCGIVGYIGDREVKSVLIEGLKKLEYRGYDSAGISVANGEAIDTIKTKGKIESLRKELDSINIQGKLGIAHTRWATHGEPTKVNAHPHLDNDGKIAIVHNGIIENYQSIKKLLKKDGIEPVSETDSELIAHLIAKFYDGDLETAIARTVKILEGTFGIAAIHAKENRIVAARRGSPLVVGVGEDEMIVASDVVPIMNITRNVNYLEDDQIAIIDQDGYTIKDINGDPVSKHIEQVKWNVEEIEKQGYKHFMLKEIMEQPDSIANTMRGRLKDGNIKLSIDTKTDLNRIIITACGTSWHSALVGKFLLEKLTGIPVLVDYASEFIYNYTPVKEKDLFLVISQSGETADTITSLKKAQKNTERTAGIVNVVGSTIARQVNSGIYLHAGPEIGVASTKAFTCQIIALLLFALHLRKKQGRNIDKELIKEIKQIPDKIKVILDQRDKIKKISKKFKDKRNFLYLGRGINYPVALEGALKLKEISYIHAEGYPAAEMKHGPIALIDKDMPVVFLATKGKVLDKVINNMEEVKARKGIVIAVTDHTNLEVEEISDEYIEIPETLEDLSPVLNVIPLQLIAYYIADMNGLDVDKPRNLAKSVTVE